MKNIIAQLKNILSALKAELNLMGNKSLSMKNLFCYENNKKNHV